MARLGARGLGLQWARALVFPRPQSQPQFWHRRWSSGLTEGQVEVKDMSLADFYSLRRSMDTIVPADQAKLFPGLDVLDPQSGIEFSLYSRISTAAPAPLLTMVCLYSNRLASEWAESWLALWKEKVGHEPTFLSFRVTMYESLLLRGFLKRWIVRTSRKEADGSLLCFDLNLHHAREALGMQSDRANYTFLVDRQARVRWMASGPCQEEEDRNRMLQATAELIAEHEVPKPKS